MSKGVNEVMSIFNNKEVYSTVEFDCWVYKKGLDFPEQYLIENYLHKQAKILEAGTAGGRIC